MIAFLKDKTKLFLLASLVYVILGISHIATDVASHIFPENFLIKEETAAVMKNTDVKIFGTTRSVYRYLAGFSNAMGMLMVFTGLLNIVIFIRIPEFISDKYLLILNVLCSGALVIFSIIFFNLPPIFFLSGSCFLYIFLLVKFSINESNRS